MIAVVVLDSMSVVLMSQRELAAAESEGWDLMYTQWGQDESPDVWHVLPPTAKPQHVKELRYD